MPLGDADRYAISYVSFRADNPPPADSRIVKLPVAEQVVACVNPAALRGGAAVTDAILGATGAGLTSRPAGPWTRDGVPATTAFVKVPGLISTDCVTTNGMRYLAVTVNADPADPRTDTIVGDVSFGGTILKD